MRKKNAMVMLMMMTSDNNIDKVYGGKYWY